MTATDDRSPGLSSVVAKSAAWVIPLLTLVNGGCGLKEWADNGFKVGPNYSPPQAQTANAWIDYQDPRVRSQEQDLSRWWEVFNDPVLDSLVKDASEQNLSLRVAGSRIAEARAIRGIAAGNLFPQQQDASGSYTNNKVSQETVNRPTEAWFENWEAGFNLSWELDLWGRFRRSIESADAQLEASIDNYDDVLVVLLADVAANYTQYRTFQVRLALARKNVEIQEKSYQLARDKFAGGATTERDVFQSKQILDQTRSRIPDLEAGLRRTGNALCLLLGIPPRDLSERLGAAGIPTAPPEVALGIPADLLRRRPDVRRAERLAAAQSASIGIAKADLYPRFSILGGIGVRSEDFGDLFDTPESLDGFIGPAFRWDILNYGRIENSVKVQEARFEGLVYEYQNTVLRAGREAEDALVSFLNNQQRAKYLADSVDAAQRTVDISYVQYQQGVIDFTPVFLFELTLTEQQDQLAQARGDISAGLIDVYRSLGGGWQMRQKSEGAPATQPAVSISSNPE